jgi:hypothetical protein
MEFIPTLVLAVYPIVVIATIIYVLILLGRSVNAQERVAGSLDIIAHRMRDEGRP